MDGEQHFNLLKKIQEMEFVALELNLYLDTHPRDEDALNDFNCAAELLHKQRQNYEQHFGPLLNFGMGGYAHDRWYWNDEPWPWEI